MVKSINKRLYAQIEIERLLSILMIGTGAEIREAKREIDQLWHKNTGGFKKYAYVVLKQLGYFDNIKKVENQAAFVSGLSLFFLVLGDDHFDRLKDFTLKVIQHPNGHVRQAMINTAEWLYVSLTARVNPFMYPKGKKLTKKQKVIQSEAQFQYINLINEIEFLLDKYDKETESVEYVDEMKPSVSKSLQIFWSRLAERPMYRKIMERVRPLPYEIARKRKEIEGELSAMLRETGSDFDLDNIKEIIYNEDGQDSLTKIITMFDNGQGIVELNNILELINDAWNYFPHKSLNGLSPMEVIKSRQNNGSSQKN